MSPGDYPEHEKLAKVSEESNAIGAFLDYGKWTLCRWSDDFDEFQPLKIETALAEWYGIDPEALSREKDRMLAELRAATPGKVTF